MRRRCGAHSANQVKLKSMSSVLCAHTRTRGPSSLCESVRESAHTGLVSSLAHSTFEALRAGAHQQRRTDNEPRRRYRSTLRWPVHVHSPRVLCRETRVHVNYKSTHPCTKCEKKRTLFMIPHRVLFVCFTGGIWRARALPLRGQQERFS